MTAAPPPGDHGGDGARLAAALGVAATDILDISLSLNPVAPDVGALVQRAADAARRYPDDSRARAALAEAIGVPRQHLLVTNGGAEAIALVAAEHPVGWVEQPEFSLYARHLARLDPAGPRWQSNPNNPTGRLAPSDATAAVWDEAFYPLATGSWTRGDFEHGAIVLGSLTKVFACPGLRLGYVLAPDAEVIERLAARQARWSVNALAAAVLPELLASADLVGWHRATASLRMSLIELLAAHELRADPSDAPYLLVRSASGLREHLARSGVLVRDTASFGLPGGVRLAVPDEAGLERLADAMAGYAPAPEIPAAGAAWATLGQAFRAKPGTATPSGRGASHASPGAFADALGRLRPLDAMAMTAAGERHDHLAKPQGSLGHLELLGAQLAGIACRCPPPIPVRPVVALFAADHGVVAAGVTPWPQAITTLMVRSFVAGGAAISAIARQVGATVHVVDIGLASPQEELPREVDQRRVRSGTADLSRGPALTVQEAWAALDVGTEIARQLIAGGADLLITGEMGIGNTTPSAALVARLTGRPAAAMTGRGTGIDEPMLARKAAVIEAAVARAASDMDPLSVLAELGGLEIAGLTGLIVGAGAARVPVVIDGVIACAALLVAEALAPGVSHLVIAGHRSTEPAATAVLEHLGLRPLLDLDLRLGEGTGACLAVPLVQAAARVLNEMATLDQL